MHKVSNIVIVGPAHPYRGGIAHFNESFARSLKRQNISSTLVSFSLQYPSILFPGKSQYTDSKAPEDLDIKRWISSVNPISWKSAAKKISKLHPDVVVIRYWHPFMAPALGTIAGSLRKRGIKVIGLIDNAIPHEPKFYDLPSLRYFAARCTGFFTLSTAVAEDMNKLGLSKPIETSPHPIYDIFGHKVDKAEARRELGLRPEDRVLLFFGFVRAYKGLDLLLQSMAQKMVRQLNVKLLVAGEFYEDKKKYTDLIQSLNLQDKVIIHENYIPEDRVKFYFGAADLVTQTYKSATQSGVTQIAYHFDKPMLVTNVGGLSEIVDHEKNGFVVEPNPQAIGAAIYRYFHDHKEDAFEIAVRKGKERFSWSFFTKKFISFAESI